LVTDDMQGKEQLARPEKMQEVAGLPVAQPQV
jgi:hypothetical protein